MVSRLQILVLLVSSSAVCSLAKSYHGHSVIKLVPRNVANVEYLKYLHQIPSHSLDLWSEYIGINKSLLLSVNLNAKHDLLKYLTEEQIIHQVLTEDLQSWIDEEVENPSKNNSFNYNNYQRFETIEAHLKDLAKKHKGMVKFSSIGTTYEGRQIPLLTLGTSDKAKTVLFECGIHAREWISPATCLYIVNKFLSQEYHQLLNTHRFHFLPSINPDGYSYTWTSERLWRKNRSPQLSAAPFFTCTGVDLNRNFDFHFGTVGVSRNPCSNTYPGRRGFSETETKAVRDFATSVEKSGNLIAYFAVHSFGQFWMYPTGVKTVQVKNEEQLSNLAKLATKAIQAKTGAIYRSGSMEKDMYEASGVSIDWVHSELGCKITFLIELRDTGEFGFLLPSKFIKPTAEELFAGILAVLEGI